jgi:hypothetical protein
MRWEDLCGRRPKCSVETRNESGSNGGQVPFSAERRSARERRQSPLLLLTERGYGDCFLDVSQAGNLRSGSFELKQRHVPVMGEPLNKWSPDWFKGMKPPARRRLPACVSHV